MLLEHCIVTARPTYHKNGHGYEWHCSLSAPPDIFHQDRDELVEAHAGTYAPEAQRHHLRPGDWVDLKGLVNQHELTFGNGETKIVNFVTVSDIVVLQRAKRTNLTVYERKQGR